MDSQLEYAAPNEFEEPNEEIVGIFDENVETTLKGLAENIRTVESCKKYADALDQLISSDFIQEKLYNPAGLFAQYKQIDEAVKEGDADNLKEVLSQIIVFDKSEIYPRNERKDEFRPLHVKFNEEIVIDFLKGRKVRDLSGKSIVFKACMYGGKSSLAYFLGEQAESEGMVRVPIIPSFMGQNGKIDIRSIKDDKGYLQLEGIDLGLPQGELSEEKIIEYVKGVIKSVYEFAQSKTSNEVNGSDIFLHFDEYSFMPPEILTALAEKFAEEGFVSVMAGLSHDIHDSKIPGYSAILELGTEKYEEIEACRAFVTGQDDVNPDSTQWTPSGECTSRYIPIKNANGKTQFWLADWGHVFVEAPKQLYEVIYAPKRRKKHHSTWLKKKGWNNLLKMITNPTQSVQMSQNKFAETILVVQEA